MTAPKAGDKAPDFELKDQEGQIVRLSDYHGKSNVVLFFYPKDYSPVCTIEAIAFKDAYQKFLDLGAEVLGVSADGPTSHKSFCDTHNLPFKLLTDEDQRVRKLYRPGGMLGRYSHRVTYVIDKQGIIKHCFSATFKAKAHVDEALKVLQKT